MVVRFALKGTVAAKKVRSSLHLPFECVVVIVDDRGKEHTGRVQDIWPWTRK